MRLFRLLFWLATRTGRPVGGIRPRRIVHWLALRAYGNSVPCSEEFRWCQDRWGNRLRLHPHFLIDYQVIAFGSYDAPLHRFLHRMIKPGMVCFDVGANIGCVTVDMARLVGPSGRVFSFEPVPHIFERLKENVSGNPSAGIVGLHQLALSRETGKTTLQVAPKGNLNQGMGSLQNNDHPLLRTSIQVSTSTLDDFVQQWNVARIDFIKMDTQGAEAWIIEGGKKALARFRPHLVLEVSPYNLRSYDKTSQDLLRSVESLGYECHQVNARGQLGSRVLSADAGSARAIEDLYCRYVGTKSNSQSGGARW